MSDVYVELELENYADRVLAEQGLIPETKVKRAKVKVLTDTGATLLVLPEDLVKALGLKRMERAIVTCADERKEARELAGVITVKVGNRSTETRCAVGPPGSEPLLGHTILEILDLIVDPVEGKLVPKPESPYLPTLKLK